MSPLEEIGGGELACYAHFVCPVCQGVMDGHHVSHDTEPTPADSLGPNQTEE